MYREVVPGILTAKSIDLAVVDVYRIKKFSTGRASAIHNSRVGC